MKLTVSGLSPGATGFTVALGTALTVLAVLRQLLDIRPQDTQYDVIWVLFGAMALSVVVTMAAVLLRRGRSRPVMVVLDLIWPPIAIGIALMVLFMIGYMFACAGIQTPFVRGSCE